MSNITYIVKRLFHLDWNAMFSKINSVHKKTGMSRIAIFKDMQKCARLYGAGYMDYDLFEMYNLTPEQRDTYLTRGRNNAFVVKYCDKSSLPYFINKDVFNTYFNDYLKRDWIKVIGSKKEDVMDFMKKHSVFMAKPIDGKCGKGIRKINVDEYKSLDEVYGIISSEDDNYALEEVIKQHEAVSNIHPHSINTVRIVTIVTDDKGNSILETPKEKRKDLKLVTHVIAAYFRIGNGKFVDNFNSGGMTAPIDIETGTVSQVAVDKEKKAYENHPLTNQPIKGFTFPYWKEAIQLCSDASKVIPEMGYAGWDVAFTPDGPLFVEGNEFPGHDIYQLPLHTPDKIGMMPRFDFKNKHK